MVLSQHDISFALLHIFSRLTPQETHQLSRQQLAHAWVGTRLRKNDLEAASVHLVSEGLLLPYADGADHGLRLTEYGAARAQALAGHPVRNYLRRQRIRWMLKLMRSKSILGVQRRHSDSALRARDDARPTATSPTAR